MQPNNNWSIHPQHYSGYQPSNSGAPAQSMPFQGFNVTYPAPWGALPITPSSHFQASSNVPALPYGQTASSSTDNQVPLLGMPYETQLAEAPYSVYEEPEWQLPPPVSMGLLDIDIARHFNGLKRGQMNILIHPKRKQFQFERETQEPVQTDMGLKTQEEPKQIDMVLRVTHEEPEQIDVFLNAQLIIMNTQCERITQDGKTLFILKFDERDCALPEARGINISVELLLLAEVFSGNLVRFDIPQECFTYSFCKDKFDQFRDNWFSLETDFILAKAPLKGLDILEDRVSEFLRNVDRREWLKDLINKTERMNDETLPLSRRIELFEFLKQDVLDFTFRSHQDSGEDLKKIQEALNDFAKREEIYREKLVLWKIYKENSWMKQQILILERSEERLLREQSIREYQMERNETVIRYFENSISEFLKQKETLTEQMYNSPQPRDFYPAIRQIQEQIDIVQQKLNSSNNAAEKLDNQLSEIESELMQITISHEKLLNDLLTPTLPMIDQAISSNILLFEGLSNVAQMFSWPVEEPNAINDRLREIRIVYALYKGMEDIHPLEGSNEEAQKKYVRYMLGLAGIEEYQDMEKHPTVDLVTKKKMPAQQARKPIISTLESIRYYQTLRRDVVQWQSRNATDELFEQENLSDDDV